MFGVRLNIFPLPWLVSIAISKCFLHAHEDILTPLEDLYLICGILQQTYLLSYLVINNVARLVSASCHLHLPFTFFLVVSFDENMQSVLQLLDILLEMFDLFFQIFHLFSIRGLSFRVILSSYFQRFDWKITGLGWSWCLDPLSYVILQCLNSKMEYVELIFPMLDLPFEHHIELLRCQ